MALPVISVSNFGTCNICECCGMILAGFKYEARVK